MWPTDAGNEERVRPVVSLTALTESVGLCRTTMKPRGLGVMKGLGRLLLSLLLLSCENKLLQVNFTTFSCFSLCRYGSCSAVYTQRGLVQLDSAAISGSSTVASYLLMGRFKSFAR
ncbi:hypothetical protein AMECASPLE_030493 [Ameca splendens]|uniref:Uncharacterized protein n=1 Tax=Ameca splendens TaxID=208324 RepID=A0ABV0XVJ3_9TELE